MIDYIVTVIVNVFLWVIQPEVLIAWLILALIVGVIIGKGIKKADEKEKRTDT